MAMGSTRQSYEKRCSYCGSEQVKPSKSGQNIMDCVCGEKFEKRG